MIYFDNAATERMDPAVAEAILPYLTEDYGNPSSSHLLGRNASNAINGAREKIARILGLENRKIIFTSGGSEANNQALMTAAEIGRRNGKNRIIISAIEHDSLFKAAKRYEQLGFDLKIIPVDNEGFLDISALKHQIDEKTLLVSAMAANNEIGTIEPLAEIGAICRESHVLFHSDGVQAAGHIPLNFGDLNLDMLSLSAHKFGGMKGVGALCVSADVEPMPLIYGGGQEKGFRGGTENVAGIVSMALALERKIESLKENSRKTKALRDRLEAKLLSVEDISINGSKEYRLDGNLNISFGGINGEALVLMLDEMGICASVGAACHSGKGEESRVLKAIGLDARYALGSVRFSLCESNTEEEVDFAAEAIKNAVANLRK